MGCDHHLRGHEQDQGHGCDREELHGAGAGTAAQCRWNPDTLSDWGKGEDGELGVAQPGAQATTTRAGDEGGEGARRRGDVIALS